MHMLTKHLVVIVGFTTKKKALRNEPMNTREETYMAIRKMFATLDDHFTLFLEPGKFNSL